MLLCADLDNAINHVTIAAASGVSPEQAEEQNLRPDRFVAWRSMGAGERPLQESVAAFGQILARPAGEAAVPAGIATAAG